MLVKITVSTASGALQASEYSKLHLGTLNSVKIQS